MAKVKVLVVVDVQNDFCDGTLGTPEAEATVPAIFNKISECGEKGYLIFNTKDTHNELYISTNEGKHLPIAHTQAGTSGWEVVPPVRSALNKYHSVELLKNKFGSDELPHAIKAVVFREFGEMVTDGRDMDIIIIGWCTDICVITNALLLKTAFPETNIIVDSACCAGVTPKLHEAALAVMKSCQIIVS